MKVLLTHIRREIFHACWEVLLDDDFIVAYFHGVVVECKDGVTRRLYPRIFTYSADYPEKYVAVVHTLLVSMTYPQPRRVLMATVRDKGGCPCPRCLIKFNEIPNIGTENDRSVRRTRARRDDPARREAVEQARNFIYKDGYVVNSAKVEDLLKPSSLVPTMV